MPTPPIIPVDPLNFLGLEPLPLLDRLQTLYRQANSNWDDFSSNYPENLTLQGQCLLSSLVSKAADERIRQMSWATVTDRLAAIRMGRPYGFQLTGRTAGTLDGYFYLPNSAVAASEVLIPAGSKIMSGNYVYQALGSMNILVGTNATPVPNSGMENSESYTDNFQSDEEANIVLQVDRTPIIDGSISVVAGNGSYTRTNPSTGTDWQSFLEMGPNDLGYIVLQDNNSKVYVLFGNGINGAIPTGNIAVTYKTGGGVEGEVEIGVNWTILDSIVDAGGNPVTVLFTNTTATSGGQDEMTVEEARVRGPLATRTTNRVVNEPDAEYVATTAAGLARAALMTSNHDSVIPEDEGRLYLVAYGTAYEDSGYYPPATPTAAQIAAVEALIADDGTGTYPQLMGVTINVFAAIFLTINVKAKVYKASGYAAAAVKANITESLRKLFAIADNNKSQLSTVNWGYKLLGVDGNADYKLAWSKVFNSIHDSAGVREVSDDSENVLINNYRASYVLQPNEFPVFGAVQVYDMDSGGVEI